jgi:PAS domain-containing protein
MSENIKRIKELQELLFKDQYNAINIIDELPICIHEINLEGFITKMNRAGLNMLDIKNECDILGTDYFSFVDECDIEGMRSNWDTAVNEGESIKFIFKAVNGAIYSSCFTPIIKDGNVTKVVGFSQDVSNYQYK